MIERARDRWYASSDCTATDLITGEKHDFGGGSVLPAYSAFFWKTEC